MGLKGKLIGEAEVSSHGHHAHEIYAKKPQHFSEISPSHIQGCELDQGEFSKPGSIVTWIYTVDGKACVTKCVVEELNDVEKIVAFKVIEGDLTEEYSSFVSHHYATEKEIKWVLEYERRDEDAPHPTKLLDFLLNVNKHIDDHHVKAGSV